MLAEVSAHLHSADTSFWRYAGNGSTGDGSNDKEGGGSGKGSNTIPAASGVVATYASSTPNLRDLIDMERADGKGCGGGGRGNANIANAGMGDSNGTSKRAAAAGAGEGSGGQGSGTGTGELPYAHLWSPICCVYCGQSGSQYRVVTTSSGSPKAVLVGRPCCLLSVLCSKPRQVPLEQVQVHCLVLFTMS